MVLLFVQLNRCDEICVLFNQNLGCSAIDKSFLGLPSISIAQVTGLLGSKILQRTIHVDNPCLIQLKPILPGIVMVNFMS